MAFGNVNIAKNEVTGKFIKSDPPTKKYLDNYDKAFAKKTPSDWAKDLDLEINSDSTDKISYKQFKEQFVNEDSVEDLG